MRSLPLVLLPLLAAGGVHPLDGAPAVLDRVRPLVEKACGAKFERPPKCLGLEPSRAVAVFAEDLRSEVTRLHPSATAGQRETLLRAAAEASVGSCVARYSVTVKSIVLVRDGFDRQVKALGIEPRDAGRLLEASLAHECVHALDDARFGFAGLAKRAADREPSRALAMVVEGRAVHFGRAVADGLGVPPAVRDLLPGGGALEGYREHLLRLTYEEGARFVAALVRRGGTALADRAMREPPASTHLVCHPDRWPDGAPDARPAGLLRRAFPDADVEPLSELELRARYAAMDGIEEARALFAGFRGGAKALVGGTNAAVLAFADEAAATRFLTRSRKEVPAERRGTLVLRAAGGDGEAVLPLLVRAATR